MGKKEMLNTAPISDGQARAGAVVTVMVMVMVMVSAMAWHGLGYELQPMS